jgi:hypothetical protein
VTRLRQKLSWANLAATLAVFMALGAGYASAFSGSGTLQKGSLKDIPSTNTLVRSITGIGEIQARCQTNDLRVVLHNASGQDLRVAWTAGSQYLNQVVNDGVDHVLSPGADSAFRYHVHPVDGDKRPQADIAVTIDNNSASVSGCSTSQVSALVLNTEE